MCLLYVANSCAMHPTIKKLAAVALATSPVTVTGTYYYGKTIQDQARVRAEIDAKDQAWAQAQSGKEEKEEPSSVELQVREIQRKKIEEQNNKQIYAVDSFRAYIFGTVFGVIPFFNIGIIAFKSNYYLDKFDRWAKHEQEEQDLCDSAAESGLWSGISLYATAPLALKCLRKFK